MCFNCFRECKIKTFFELIRIKEDQVDWENGAPIKILVDVNGLDVIIVNVDRPYQSNSDGRLNIIAGAFLFPMQKQDASWPIA